jgi:adenine deaminase
MDKNILKKLIDTAAGRIPADLVIKNGVIADVYSGRFIKGDMAISGGLIAALGEPGAYEGLETVDADGQYVLPGFIDSHVHIESSFLNPAEYCKLVVPCGTAAIIADPHEITNACGLAGFSYMLEASDALPLDIKFMVPSCVPATPFEHSGANLDAAALEVPLRHERVLGLGEFMDYPGIIGGNEAALDKLVIAKNFNKLIDGHSPGLAGRDLNAYLAGFIHTDHECSSPDEMRERLERGMYVMLRQGSACRDLRNLLPGVTAENSRRCILCTDDCQPMTILEQGHLNNHLRICVEEGLAPMTALRMATLNAAECFGLRDRGGFAPGLRADIVLVNNLKEFGVNRVYLGGRRVAERGRFLLPVPGCSDSAVRGTMHVKDFSIKKLDMPLDSDEVYVIDIRKGSVVTGKGQARLHRDAAGRFKFDPSMGIAKIAVVERHKNTGLVGLGLVRGYGIAQGAVAVSVSHDSHNIIVVGTNDADMSAAVERLIAMEGGAVLVKDGMVLEEMSLPLGGIMCGESGELVAAKLASIDKKAVQELGVSADVEPLMTLCFMSLLVIPELKIGTGGLFDVTRFKFIPTEFIPPEAERL